MTVAIGVVDATHAGPKLGISKPSRRPRCLLSRVGMIPIVAADHMHSVRCIAQRIVFTIHFAILNRSDLFSNRDQARRKIDRVLPLIRSR